MKGATPDEPDSRAANNSSVNAFDVIEETEAAEKTLQMVIICKKKKNVCAVLSNF